MRHARHSGGEPWPYAGVTCRGAPAVQGEYKIARRLNSWNGGENGDRHVGQGDGMGLLVLACAPSVDARALSAEIQFIP